ncbi:helix-turn-helix domain-containing protein [Sulfitobacter sp. G21635-S1]|nr:helix-turn-helix domain-containing protein [Sulfitobacter sp. G21635-S1]
MFPCAKAGLVYFGTMIATAEIFDLIEEHRKRLGLSQAEVALRAFGQNSTAAIQGLRRGKSPGIERLSSMCEVLGIELYIGPKRTPDSNQKRSNHEAMAILNDFAFVDRFDVALSAGPGAAGDNARHLAPVAFRNDWLIQQGLRADRCVVCNVRGNSMEPILFDGDLVLLNKNRSEMQDGQIFGVVDIEGDVRIKRLEQVKDGILLRSDNPESPTELRLGEDANRVRIIGALAWSSHTHTAALPRVER